MLMGDSQTGQLGFGVAVNAVSVEWYGAHFKSFRENGSSVARANPRRAREQRILGRVDRQSALVCNMSPGSFCTAHECNFTQFLRTQDSKRV